MTTPNNTVASLPEKWRGEAEGAEWSTADAISVGLNDAADVSDIRAESLRACADELEAALASPAPSAEANPNPLARYWMNRSEFWMQKAIALGWREVRDAANGEAPSVSPAVAGDGLDPPVECQRDMLAEAIRNAAVKRGIVRADASLTGPMLLLLCEDLATSEASSAPQGEVAAIEAAALYAWKHASWTWDAVKGGLDRFTTPPPAPAAEQGQPEARGVEGHPTIVANRIAQARAFEAVCGLLDQVSPGWSDTDALGGFEQMALDAIRFLATSQAALMETLEDKARDWAQTGSDPGLQAMGYERGQKDVFRAAARELRAAFAPFTNTLRSEE